MKLSFLVTVHNEVSELRRLLMQLTQNLEFDGEDEIVILDDFSDNEDTKAILQGVSTHPKIKIVQHHLNGDFGAHKTYGSEQCNGKYIFQLDADEYPADALLDNIHALRESNTGVELYRVPRVNIVRGATAEDAKQWGWHMSTLPEFGDFPIINWNSGDRQSRIYLNDRRLRWAKKLHEVIIGAGTVAELPLDIHCSIIHDKTIERQRSQNENYNKNWSLRENMGIVS
jgi:glycosyltransferase involved in cell wall biosynthesis